jgi:hypothetical protein
VVLERESFFENIHDIRRYAKVGADYDRPALVGDLSPIDLGRDRVPQVRAIVSIKERAVLSPKNIYEIEIRDLHRGNIVLYSYRCHGRRTRDGIGFGRPLICGIDYPLIWRTRREKKRRGQKNDQSHG